MWEAAGEGHIEIVNLCEEWEATGFRGVMCCAASEGHTEIVKLCKEWLFGDIHAALLKYHHEREFSKVIHDEMLSRFWSWCVNEDEKRFLGEM